MVDKYTSVKEVISKIYRDLNITEERRWEDMIEWSAEAMEHIGAHSQYVEKTVELKVDNYRAALPCDFFKIIQIESRGDALKYLSGSFDNYYHQTDSKNLRSDSTFGYNINSAFLNFNFKDGTIIMAYIAVPTDAEGFPLIPDMISYKEAITAYITMKMKYPEFVAGKLQPQLYQMFVQEWNHFCGQARGDANMPNLDKMESLKNQWMRLMPEMNRSRRFFTQLSDPERIADNEIRNRER